MSQASETIQGQVSYTSHSGAEYFLTNDSGDYKIHHRDVRRLNLSPESAGLSLKGTPKITESLNWIETGTAQINR